jgi:hypothetical protein
MGIVNTVGAQAAAVQKDRYGLQKRKAYQNRMPSFFFNQGTNLTWGAWVAEKFRVTDPYGCLMAYAPVLSSV